MSRAADRLAASLGDRYKIERELGQGGMATVYLAEDTKHHRRVAIKVLHPELSALLGTERFLKEIELTANLQHPHILALFDSGSTDGLLYYVMPYVEGETLRQRLEKESQLPVDDAIRIAVDIADALDYAHRRHVVHRDIKPENILLLDGRPLVADFGIALAVEQAGGARMTQTGISLGTPQYMAPEQAMGDKTVDHRADIYALGAVVFEMLAGEPPFTGPNTQAIVSRVITEKPRSLTSIRDTVTPEMDEAVYSALQKLPADRPQTAREFSRMLTEKKSPFEFMPAERMTSGSIAAGVAGTAILFGIAGYALGVRTHEFTASSDAPSRLAMLTPALGGTGTASLHRQIAITPDGSAVVYVAQGDDGNNVLMYQRLDSEAPAIISGSTAMLDPVVSSDGKSLLGFITSPNASENRVATLPIGGGDPTNVSRAINPSHAIVARDGSIWTATTASGLLKFSSRKTQPTGFPDTRGLRPQQLVNGERTLLAVRAPLGTNSGPVVTVDTNTGSVNEAVSEPVVEIRYAAGIVAFSKADGSLWAASFDEKKARITDEPMQIGSGVALTGTAISQFALSRNGNLAYVPEEPRWLALVDRDGKMRYATQNRRNYHAPRFSPDGSRISVDFSTATGRDVWVFSLNRGTMSRVSFDRDGHDGTWSADGQHIYYSSFRKGDFGLYRTRAGGSPTPDSLMTTKQIGYTGEWLPDGKTLITTLTDIKPNSGSDIGLVENSGRGPVRPIIADEFQTNYPVVSHDGKWLAYVSDKSGPQEVYVRPLDGDGDEVQVSNGGGTEPVWSHSGTELFYRGTSERDISLIAAMVRLSPTFDVVSRKALFPASEMAPAVPHANYDVSRDDRTFVMVRRSPATRVVVIQNVPQLLKSMRGTERPQ
jgi:serine/threonine-protein kinase